MMRMLGIVVCTLLCAGLLNAQSTDKRILLNETEQAVIQKEIARASLDIRQLTCTFTQTKHSDLLVEDVSLKGEMQYTVQDGHLSLRWTYDDGLCLTYRDGDIQILTAEGKISGNVPAQRFFREIMDIFSITISGGDVVELNEFSMTAYKDKTCVYFILEPKKKAIKKYFTSFELVFNSKDYMGEGIVINEKGGDITTVRLLKHKNK